MNKGNSRSTRNISLDLFRVLLLGAVLVISASLSAATTRKYFDSEGAAKAACGAQTNPFPDPPGIHFSGDCLGESGLGATAACDRYDAISGTVKQCIEVQTNFSPGGGGGIASFRFVWEQKGATCGAGYPGVSENGMECKKHPGNEGPQDPCTGTIASNPINYSTGNKYQVEADYIGVGSMPLEFRRTYNSRNDGWAFSYTQHLQLLTSRVILRRETGGGIIFTESTPGIWITNADEPTTLVVSGTEWVLTNSNDTTEKFDAAGKLIELKNRAGLTITFTYDVNDRLTNVVHFSGRTLGLGYDPSDRISSLTDPNNEITNYAYDTNNRLISVTYPDQTPANAVDNPIKTYHYENISFPNALTGITDENGDRFATYSYDTQGRGVSSEHAGGVEKDTFVYNVDGTSTITNVLGKSRTVTMTTINGLSRVAQIDGAVSPLCSAYTQAVTYDAAGYMDTRTDKNGNVTDYIYDARGLVSSKIEALGTLDARTTTYTWHATLRVPTQIVRDGQTIDMTYDAAGRLLTRKLTDTQTQTIPYTTTGNERLTTYTYNGFGLVASVDGPRVGSSDTTTFTYDLNGDLSKVTNALSQVTEILSRDGAGRVTSIKAFNGLITNLTYDARGRLITRTVSSTQGNAITSFVYDGVGQLTQITIPNSTELNYQYDAAHRLARVFNNTGEEILYTLDLAGNTTKTEVKNGESQIVFTQSQTFDELSRLLKVIDANSDATAFEYDNLGNNTKVDDGLSRSTLTPYDALNRIEKITDAASNDSTFTYDARDNLTQVVDPRGITTSYIYDGLDNVIQESSPDTGIAIHNYDAAGNLISTIDAKSVVANYAYDDLNRLSAVTYPADISENINYTYDQLTNGIGKLTAISDSSGSSSYEFDDRGNLTKDTRVIKGTSYVTSYSHDLADHLLSMTYPSGRVLNYALDSQSRVNQIDSTKASITQSLIDKVEYQPFGAPRVVGFGNAVRLVFDTSTDGRISQRLLTNDPNSLTANSTPYVNDDAASLDVGETIIIDATANDFDLDGDTLVYINLTQGVLGTVSVNGDGTLSYVSTGTTSATDSFTYQLHDGLSTSNTATVSIVITAPSIVDTDGDGIADEWEISFGFDPNDASDATLDPDGDGVSNFSEYQLGTDPLFNPNGYASAVLAANPLAYWRMDDASATAIDDTTNGLDGSYYSPYTQLTSSVISEGTAVDVASGGRIEIPHNSLLNMQADYTIEMYLRWTSTGIGMVYGKFRPAPPWDGAVVYANLKDGVGNTGYLQFRDRDGLQMATVSNALNDGVWRHYAFVRRGTTLEIWINGELDASGDLGSATAFTHTGPVYIMNNQFAQSVVGSIDEIALYSSALTKMQIIAHVQSAGDVDFDGIPTHDEILLGMDPLDSADATQDFDGDGATNYDEYVTQTDIWAHPLGYGAAVSADSPLAYWRMDDASATAIDDTTNGLDGSYYSPYTQLVPSVISEGTAVDVASGGRIEIPHNSLLNMQADYTIEMYLRWTSTGIGMVYGKFRPAPPWDGAVVYANLKDGAANVGFIQFRDQNGWQVTSTSSGLNNGAWHHYAFVRRGTQLEIWIDGKFDNSIAIASVTAFNTTSPVYLMNNQFAQSVVGSIDEVALYTQALSAADIKQHVYQGTLPSQASVLPNTEELYSFGLKPGFDRSTVLLTDNRTFETIYWMYDSHSTPQMRAVEDISKVNLNHFNTLIEQDALGRNILVKNETGGFRYIRKPNGQRKGLVAVMQGPLNEAWNYTYDAVGNITGISQPVGSAAYSYDVLDRLTSDTPAGVSNKTYTYDFVGNRTSETEAGITQNHTYASGSNRQATQSGITIGYDANGNRTSDNGYNYTYTVRNRLSVVKDSTQTTLATYSYNALGQRVNKLTTAIDVDYVYDFTGALIGEYSNGVLIQEYVYVGGIPVAQIDSSENIIYLHADHLGSPRAGTDLNGQVVWLWEGAAFGSNAANEDPDGDFVDTVVNLRFPGQYYDEETGKHYNYFRDYDPATGRYLQSDPIGLRGGLNTYGYVYGAPTKYSDYYGLDASLYPKDPATADPSDLTDGFVPRPKGPNIADLIGDAATTFQYMQPMMGNFLTDPQGNLWPGFSEQDWKCSVPGVGCIMDKNPDLLERCINHDQCFEDNQCNVSSLIGNYLGADKPCNQCNRDF